MVSRSLLIHLVSIESPPFRIDAYIVPPDGTYAGLFAENSHSRQKLFNIFSRFL